jgi:hypothetical protein
MTYIWNQACSVLRYEDCMCVCVRQTELDKCQVTNFTRGVESGLKQCLSNCGRQTAANSHILNGVIAFCRPGDCAFHNSSRKSTNLQLVTLAFCFVSFNY